MQMVSLAAVKIDRQTNISRGDDSVTGTITEHGVPVRMKTGHLQVLREVPPTRLPSRQRHALGPAGRPTFWRNIHENARVYYHHCVRSCHSGNVIRSANERPLDACRCTRPARHRRAGRPDTSIKFRISKNGSCVVKNCIGIRHLGVWPDCQRFVANSQSGDGFETFAVFSSLTCG